MRLIDADAFKEYCRNGYEEAKHYYKDGGKFAKEVTESFCKDIDEQPTVTERTGHWIHHPEWEVDGECGYECSECHMGSEIDTNYCPNCGAHMKGAE